MTLLDYCEIQEYTFTFIIHLTILWTFALYFWQLYFFFYTFFLFDKW